MSDHTENPNFNFRAKSLVRLLDELGYPDPDDADGGWGPIGPVVRGINWAALNPQPLPPRWVIDMLRRFGPQPDPWRVKEGPHPDPWKSALLARLEIDRVVVLAQTAAVVGGEQGREVVRRRLAEIVDEWCGTPPKPRWPLPWPFPLRWRNEELKIGPADLVLMGVQFHKTAEALGDSGLAEEFTAAADRLTQTGLERLDAEAVNQ